MKKLILYTLAVFLMIGCSNSDQEIQTFTSLRADILGVETLDAKLISERVHTPVFNFNKIEPLAFSASSYINHGDSVELAVAIVAYDSTEAMKLRYWEDDTTYIGVDATSYQPYSKVKHADRELTNMKTYIGTVGNRLKFSGGPGDHIIVGEIAVKEKGVQKWMPWKFNYTVGVPFGIIQAVETQVLYRDWDNKILVSAVGYPQEKVLVSCSGCKVRDQRDEYGFFIVNAGQGEEAIITLSVLDDSGKKVDLYIQSFRILDKGESPIDF